REFISSIGRCQSTFGSWQRLPGAVRCGRHVATSFARQVRNPVGSRAFEVYRASDSLYGVIMSTPLSTASGCPAPPPFRRRIPISLRLFLVIVALLGGGSVLRIGISAHQQRA